MTNILPKFNAESDNFLFMVGGIRLKEPGQMVFVKPSGGKDSNKVVWLPSDVVHEMSMRGDQYAELASHPGSYTDRTNDMYAYWVYAGPSNAVEIPLVTFVNGALLYENGKYRTLTWMHAGAQFIPLEMSAESYESLRNSAEAKAACVYEARNYPGIRPGAQQVLKMGYSVTPQTATFMAKGPLGRNTVDEEEQVTGQILRLVDLDLAILASKKAYFEGLGDGTVSARQFLHANSIYDTKNTIAKAEECKRVAKGAFPGYEILRSKGFTHVPEGAFIDPDKIRDKTGEEIDAYMSCWLQGVRSLTLPSLGSSPFQDDDVKPL